MWDLDRISWAFIKIKYIGAFQLPDISLQDPIGTKENHVGSCRNGVQDPVRDLGKLGLVLINSTHLLQKPRIYLRLKNFSLSYIG